MWRLKKEKMLDNKLLNIITTQEHKKQVKATGDGATSIK